MLKVIKTLSAEIRHPEDQDFVWTVRMPDMVERGEMAGLLVRLSDKEWVAGHFREASEDVVKALAIVTVDIRGAADETGKELDFAADKEGVIRAIVAGPVPLSVPTKDENGNDARGPLSAYIVSKLYDVATFGLDPEGKASPAPRTDS